MVEDAGSSSIKHKTLLRGEIPTHNDFSNTIQFPYITFIIIAAAQDTF